MNIDRFIAAAEESTQHAFQSLESIVRAFGSISMMLDSTFNAVHSSFRAVLGMADQFSRLRSHLSRVFSALAIFRTAKWAYLKLLYFMGQYDIKYLLCSLFAYSLFTKSGLTRQNPNSHPLADAWSTGLGGPLSEADIKKPRSSWPITMFMAIIISAPYLIWRIISSLDSSSDSPGIINTKSIP
jgi:peroxin-13